MSETAALPAGVRRACEGLIAAEGQLSPAYRAAIRRAEAQVGAGFAPAAQAARGELVQAIKLNLCSSRDWPYERLCRRYVLALGRPAFRAEKERFCRALVWETGLLSEKNRRGRRPRPQPDLRRGARRPGAEN